MYVETAAERDSVLDTVWLEKDEREQLLRFVSAHVSRRILLMSLQGCFTNQPSVVNGILPMLPRRKLRRI